MKSVTPGSYVGGMWEGNQNNSELTVDDREQQLALDLQMISMLQARLLDNLEWFDSAQVASSDGAKSLSEWLARKADIGLDTARRLVRTMRRTESKPHLRRALAGGLVSFDRVEAVSKLKDEPDLDSVSHLDIAGVRRLAADQVLMTAEDESRSASDQFLVMQPSLDESWWKLWGGVDGLTGAEIHSSLKEKADQIPELPDGTRGSAGWRMALAFHQVATGGRANPAQVTVFVDANEAVATNGKTGVRLQAGPRVGARALESVLCDAITEVTVNGADAVPMKYGRSARAVPPALHRAVLGSTGGYCAIAGCDSRYRVEAHHIIPFSEGGATDPENLIPICWFHHHIAIHQQGFQVFKHPQHGRWHLQKPVSVENQPVSAGANRTTQG